MVNSTNVGAGPSPVWRTGCEAADHRTGGGAAATTSRIQVFSREVGIRVFHDASGLQCRHQFLHRPTGLDSSKDWHGRGATRHDTSSIVVRWRCREARLSSLSGEF
jgi:hypothetical protein